MKRKEEEDVFKKFRDSFRQMDGHFHILEQRIPVEVQMAYFKHSDEVRKEGKITPPLNDEESEVVYRLLGSEESTQEEKKDLLTTLAISKSVKAYRLLEEYVRQPDPEVSDWAYMALMESRISLESELSDEKQIYISTGLGGKGEKLRFYILILSIGRKPIADFQKQMIEREFPYYLSRANCEIERLTVEDLYVELLFLVPVKSDIKAIIDNVIDECNQYGNFLSKGFTITNVKEMTKEEIEELLEKDGDDKTGY